MSTDHFLPSLEPPMKMLIRTTLIRDAGTFNHSHTVGDVRRWVTCSMDCLSPLAIGLPAAVPCNMLDSVQLSLVGMWTGSALLSGGTESP